MTTVKPEYIRIRLSLVEELIAEAKECCEDGYSNLAYVAGQLKGVTEAAIDINQCALPRSVTEIEREIREDDLYQIQEKLESIQEKINA